MVIIRGGTAHCSSTYPRVVDHTTVWPGSNGTLKFKIETSANIFQYDLGIWYDNGTNTHDYIVPTDLTYNQSTNRYTFSASNGDIYSYYYPNCVVYSTTVGNYYWS